MKTALPVLAALGLVLVGRWFGEGQVGKLADEASMALGLVLIVSYLVGSFLPRFNLPMITGYMITGVVLGPSFLKEFVGEFTVISEPALSELALINHIALGLIAFTAGGELKLSEIKQRWKGLLSITLVQSVVTFLGVGLLVYWLGGSLPGLDGLDRTGLMVASVLLGCTAVAKSPATTIAVINESKSAGPMTQVALGVTVIKDLVVIGFFAAAYSVGQALIEPGHGADAHLALEILWEILGSLVVGAVLGRLVIWFVESLAEELPLVLLAVAFLAVYLAEHVHLHGLMICMTAGFVVENFSPHGEEFIHAVERYSLPVYVVFFTLAGADMDIQALLKVGWVPVLLVVLRFFFTYFGTWLGAHLAGEATVIRNYAGLGFLGQAGVTLGFAVLIRNGFPSLGDLMATIIVAAVAINQIIGPVAFRYALGVAGEVGARKD